MYNLIDNMSYDEFKKINEFRLRSIFESSIISTIYNWELYDYEWFVLQEYKLFKNEKWNKTKQLPKKVLIA